jgi:hypothetical protein
MAGAFVTTGFAALVAFTGAFTGALLATGFGAGLFVAASALPPRSEKVRRRERKVMPLMAARVREVVFISLGKRKNLC